MKRATTIAFANYKGGTGKTTSCVNIAGYLAKLGKKVLVIDLDPQANATATLGIDKSQLKYTIFDALLYKTRNNPGISIKKTILLTEFEDLFIIPSNLSLIEAEFNLQSSKNSSLILDNCIDEIRHLFDYILIDTASGPNFIMINSLASADKLIIPIDLSLYSLDALEDLKTFYYKIKNQRRHTIDEFIVIYNRYQKPNLLTKILNKIFNTIPQIDILLAKNVNIDFYIEESSDVFYSQYIKTPISHLNKRPKIGKSYENIANYIINPK